MSRCRRKSECGGATTEVVIITPLLLLMLMFVVQFALWEHAGHVAQAAAIEGARAARLEGGTSDEGQATATQFLQQLGNHIITSPAVAVSKTATTATVTISGYSEEVIPGVRMPIKATSSGPVETLQ